MHRASALFGCLLLGLVGCEREGERPVEYPAALPEQPTLSSAEMPAASAQVDIGVEPGTTVDTDPSALTDFREDLDPYGTWVDDGTYGTVWVPSPEATGPDFAPYVSAGYWVHDDLDGWVWVSDYAWGWAPFHYGRWVWIAGPGWAWIPGRRYAGAWVVWRTGDIGYDYVGWGPAPPLWIWRSGIAVGIGFAIATPYVFCPTRFVFVHGFGRHIVTGGRVPVVANHTRPYVGAPAPRGPGHVPARPVVAGPAPHLLGIPAPSVAHPTGAEPGVARARNFSISRPLPTPAPAVPPRSLPSVPRPTPRAPSPALPPPTYHAPSAPLPSVPPPTYHAPSAPAPVPPMPHSAPIAPAPRLTPAPPPVQTHPAPVAPGPRAPVPAPPPIARPRVVPRR